MTGVRHLLLAVMAAVLALGLGLAVGAGPVVGRSEARRADRSDRLTARADRLAATVSALRQEASTDAKVVAAFAAPLVRGRLSGRSVLVVRTPGASAATVRAVRADLLGAGASITGELTIGPSYLDPGQAAAPLEDLALRLVPPKVTFADGATSIQRVSTVLARSTVAAEPPQEPDHDAAQVIAGMAELGAAHLSGTPGRLASLAVVVTGSEKATAQDAVLALVTALDAGSAGTVLVGPGGQAVTVGWARTAGIGGASSVDSVETMAGRTAAVLALVEQVAGGKGSYGTGAGATGVLPASVLSAAAGG